MVPLQRFMGLFCAFICSSLNVFVLLIFPGLLICNLSSLSLALLVQLFSSYFPFQELFCAFISFSLNVFIQLIFPGLLICNLSSLSLALLVQLFFLLFVFVSFSLFLFVLMLPVVLLIFLCFF